MNRSSGVLLHITSLPGHYGIGTLGKQAKNFADFCYKAGLSYWQILPIGPTGYGNSPYQSDSVFAGNPNLIGLEPLIELGWLTTKECESFSWGKKKEVCFQEVESSKQKALRMAFNRAQKTEHWEKVERFCRQEKKWLSDYALYCAIKEKNGGKSWQNWEVNIRSRSKSALERYRKELEKEIKYHCFVQYLFYTQWKELKTYCNQKGVQLIGDIPIYVAQDSCDTWVNSRLFEYDRDFKPIRVAGCPPDYFSKTGQLWGNPLYRWDVMEQEGFEWWIERIAGMSRLFDVTRIDHFRGFAGYYAVNSKEKTAEHGRWEKGPGKKLFSKMRRQLPNVQLIAEDLGTITRDVEQLRDWCGFPGMKILQFAFSPNEESSYLPHNCPKKAVMYTGTHDNDTSLGWAENLNSKEWNQAREYMGIDRKKDISWAMIRTAWTSPCELAIAPMQDFLSLDSKARMNTPSTVGGNWSWRMSEGAADEKLAKKVYSLNQATWRLPKRKKNIRAVILDKK